MDSYIYQWYLSVTQLQLECELCSPISQSQPLAITPSIHPLKDNKEKESEMSHADPHP